jgi:hypothetical protein
MWYNNIKLPSLGKIGDLDNNILKNKQVILTYLLFVFVMTNLLKTSKNKNFIYVIFFMAIIILSINLYLGLIFLVLMYIQSLNLKSNKKETSELFKEDFSEETNTNTNTKESEESDKSYQPDEKVEFIFKTLLKYDDFEKMEENNFYLLSFNDLFNKNLDKILNEEYIKSLESFKELYKIHLLDYQKCLFLIKNNINTIKQLKLNKDKLTRKEAYGLNYYLNKEFSSEHYILLYELYFDHDLYNSKTQSISNSKALHVHNYVNNDDKVEVIQKLTNKNQNIELVKDIKDFLVLLSYLNILVDDLYTPINYIKTIENLSRKKVDDTIFKKYNIYKRSKQYYTNYVDTILKDKSQNVSEKDFSQKDTRKIDSKDNDVLTEKKIIDEYLKHQKLKKTLLDKEYKSVSILDDTKKKNNDKDNIKILFTDFSKNMQDIIEDIVDLFSKQYITEYLTEESKESEESDETNTNYVKMYLYYFKELIIILTKKNRMFYTGFLFLAVSIMVYFIDSTK